MKTPCNILITGGTGLIGRQLCAKLIKRGYAVAVLSRKETNLTDIPVYQWDEQRIHIPHNVLDNINCIVHLAGSNIGEKRWTKARKQTILNSRVQTARLIYNQLQSRQNNITTFISASATGYYGSVTKEGFFDESDPPGKDFLGQTCQQWEQAADQFESAGIRTVKIRTGLVLARQGSILDKMLLFTTFGIQVIPGNGNQYIPWIHIDDLCDIYIKAIEDIKMQGSYNAIAPDQKTYHGFMDTISQTHQKSALRIHIPGRMMKSIIGKRAGLLLEGSRLASNKLENAGFHFRYANLENALNNLLPAT